MLRKFFVPSLNLLTKCWGNFCSANKIKSRWVYLHFLINFIMIVTFQEEFFFWKELQLKMWNDKEWKSINWNCYQKLCSFIKTLLINNKKFDDAIKSSFWKISTISSTYYDVICYYSSSTIQKTSSLHKGEPSLKIYARCLPIGWFI